MMRARGAQRMPPDRPLPLADIELIEGWILAGAKESPADPLPSCVASMPATADAAADPMTNDAAVPPDARPTDANASVDAGVVNDARADTLASTDGGQG